MSRVGLLLLRVVALVVAVLFLGGAVLSAMSDRALAASPARDAGSEARTFFPATKSAPLPRPRARDGGAPVYFPASKSPGFMELRNPEQNAP